MYVLPEEKFQKLSKAFMAMNEAYAEVLSVITYDKWVDASEACEILNRDKRHLRYLVSSGKIRAKKKPGAQRGSLYKYDDLKNYVLGIEHKNIDKEGIENKEE